MAEKHIDPEVGQAPAYDGGDVEGSGYGSLRRKSKVEEGARNLGDVGALERYGYVERG
jgi:hypothetical protein